MSEAAARNSRTRSRLTSFGRQPAEGPQASGQNADGQPRELVRQCFLFTNHLLLCTRTKEGKLELVEVSWAAPSRLGRAKVTSAWLLFTLKCAILI